MSFRKRLTLTTGAALALVLAALGLLVWVTLYGLLNYNARTLLQAEIIDVAPQIVLADTLNAAAYNWDEPHHRFEGPHVDPYYMQVFDPNGQMLHASENISFFSPFAYPDLLLAAPGPEGRLFSGLQTFRADDVLLYYLVQPVRSSRGDTLGYVQAARREPGIAARLQQVGGLLLIGWLLVLAGLSALVWWAAGRVLRPLAAITEATRLIAPAALNQRFPVPAEADAETAQLAATLNALLDRLERSFEEMQRFTADAAHELQTPLTVLLGHVEVALRRMRTPEAYRQTLGVLQEEITGLIRMVRGLLLLARLDREADALAREPLDLAALLREEASRAAAGAQSKGLKLHLDAPDTAMTWGQRDLLREVVHNLLDNAVKYTAAGSIHVTLETGDGCARLEIKDTGPGIAPEALPHVTERFYRAPSVDAIDVPGSGIGLSLVAQVVARHEGKLSICSAPGQGTHVQVELPLLAPAPAPALVLRNG